MPSEPLPIDRKDLFKDRKPSSSEPVEIVQARWRESPTTPSSHPNNHGSSSSGWGGGGGPFHSRRSFTDVHTKPGGGGWHSTSVESGPGMSVDLGSQKDGKGGNFWDTTASPTGNSHPHADFVSSWDQHQLNDQHAKSNVDGVTTTGGKRLEKEISLGSSLDWKPLKWIRSGSLSSRGSGFSHSSSCKIVGVESFDAKMEAQPGNVTLLPSLSGDAATCLTPKTPDEASSRKKPRLGWGEGLAKYEKKKVDPDDIVDKENAVGYGTVDGVSNSELLLPSPNLPGKSPSLTGYSESASPTTSCSFACSLSPGLEEKTSITATTGDNDTCNPSVSCHMSQNQSQGLTFNLENLDLTESLNLSTSLDELMQTDVTSASGSGFAMNKLHVWKADISRTLEITESEIDTLEHELKSLISDGGSCSYSPTSCSFLKECNNKNTEDPKHISSIDMLIEKTDGFLEHSSVKDSSRESPCTSSFKLVEPHSDAIEQNDSAVNLNTRSEKSESSQDHVCGNGSQVPIGSCIVSDGSAVYYGTEDKLYDSILASNKVIASISSTEFSKILPTTDLCTSVLRATDVSLIRKKIAMRKRFLRFKERVITLKFRAFQYSWKEDLRLLSVRRVGAKSQKRLESSSRTGYNDHQKHRAPIHLRLSPAGSLRLVSTTEVVEHAKKLLSDSRVRTYRNVLKMPAFMLDKRERMGTRFISDNGLVENPVDVEKEKSIVNPWTVEDKEMFLDKYALFGKDFRRIASFFQHKTVADCVEFYYKNHKSEEFQKTKKNSKFAKEKSCNTNTNTTYLVTSGKRLNRETGATSLDMLGAASVMVANVDGSILERSNDIAMYCNEQETAAADVLAGICGGSISSDALGSCITSSVDHGDVHRHQVRRCQKLGGSSKRHEGSSSLNDVDEETCSDDSCGEEINSSIWTEEEKLSFIKAVKSYGKDFSKVSRCVGTRSMDQCSLFFSKTKKCFGFDVIDLGAGSEGTTGANQGSGGGGSDQDDACMVDSGSGISNDKSSVECKMEVEDLHSSDFREEHAESGRNNCREPGLVMENLARNDHEAEIKPGCRQRSSSNGNLEGAADSEAAASLEESLQITCSDSASGAKVEEEEEEEAAAKICREEELRESENQLPSSSSMGGVNISTARGGSAVAEDFNSASYYSRLDLNAASDNNQEPGNGLTTSNLFPQDFKRKSVSQDDVSSRLAFRKSGQRSSSIIEGYHLNLSKPCPSYSEPHTNMKLDKSLLMPRDECIQLCHELTSDDASVSQQQQRRRSSSLDEPTSKSGDLKLFGQIITNHSSKLQQQPLPKANGNVQETEKLKPDGGKSSSSLKFDHHRKVASLDFDQSKEYGFGVESNLQLKRSYGFWDGNRIQTGFSSLPDSAVLLAKYPAAFGGNISSTFSKLDQQQQHHSSLENGNVVSGFQTRKPTNSNRIASYHSYGQSFTVDKLLPEMPKRKELEALSSSVQQGSRGVNVVGGVCNGGGGGGGVSDPVAAIRMHYAKTSEQYKNVGPEAWRSDIGSR